MTFGGPIPGSAPTVDRQPAPLTSCPTSQARGQRARCQTRHRRTSHSRPPRPCSNATPKDSHGATTTVSTWALHVIAVEATRCARREVHVQVERKDAGGHRARDWHTDGSALHGRRYAPDTEPAPPRSGKHEVPQKGRAS